jgi:hypothetical protein
MGRSSLVRGRPGADISSMGGMDPRLAIEAPVRRELAWVVVRGIALVAIIAALAACPLACPLDVPTCDRLAMVAPTLLLGYGALMLGRRLIRGVVAEEARQVAWDRAREVDAADAALGRMVSAWVPVGLLAALTLVLWPHITDANPALACAWVVIGLPPMVAAWIIASSVWLDTCRDDLARAEGESDALFRRYWANVGR